ncbi:hypothetical protein EYC98_01300 [Halieaceae bacterium IMCC14734]|uniref:Poly(Hydroxyalkanoate) granule-associated protein n=1 Tax=Candidatus Litorirhabdus singularis TaxID=2518993 RepID=A0ABT3TB16_9GAMM|nr:phasin family protein [Candidatus Litorirhabdus singularis]MCX2979491.1 hypothetical protein [Candidatus Litorirhabdus singularis]
MSDDKSNVSDKASEIAKNIWLAGLGAYGKAFDEAQDRLDKASKEPPRLFKDLVKKGEELEGEVRGSIATIRKSRTSSVEERIKKVRENFHLNLGGRQDELKEIHSRLDQMDAKLDALTAALTPATPAKKPRRKAAPAKKTPVRKKG